MEGLLGNDKAGVGPGEVVLSFPDSVVGASTLLAVPDTLARV
jgi:hypothetical protein